MFGRVPGTRSNISESHSEISTRVPFCIAGYSGGEARAVSALAAARWDAAFSRLEQHLVCSGGQYPKQHSEHTSLANFVCHWVHAG